jgi:hypothetical protein
MTVMSLDEVVNEADWIRKKHGVDVDVLRCPHGSDFVDDLPLNGRELSRKMLSHKYSSSPVLKTAQLRGGE